MNSDALIVDLRNRGVELTVDGDHLRYRAPRGTLSADDLATLRSHKSEIHPTTCYTISSWTIFSCALFDDSFNRDPLCNNYLSSGGFR